MRSSFCRRLRAATRVAYSTHSRARRGAALGGYRPEPFPRPRRASQSRKPSTTHIRSNDNGELQCAFRQLFRGRIFRVLRRKDMRL